MTRWFVTACAALALNASAVEVEVLSAGAAQHAFHAAAEQWQHVSGNTVNQQITDRLLDYFAIKGQEGRPQAEQRKWRFNLVTRYQFSEAQTLAYLERITAPTLYVDAEQSIIPRNAVVQKRKEAVARLMSYTLPGGHHLHMDDPEPVASVIRRFLKLEEV